MSSGSAEALRERLTSDEKLLSRFQAATTMEEKRRVLAEAGCEVTDEDLVSISKMGGVSELPDEDLEKVAGGVVQAPITQSQITGT
jgi:predicted ribosomally synthesized peptide with nif11-like leader